MPRKKRLRESALLAPIGGLLLFMPPYIRIFDQPSSLFGIPILHIYIFSVWLAGVVLTAEIARRIAQRDRWPDPHADKDRQGPSGS